MRSHSQVRSISLHRLLLRVTAQPLLLAARASLPPQQFRLRLHFHRYSNPCLGLYVLGHPPSASMSLSLHHQHPPAHPPCPKELFPGVRHPCSKNDIIPTDGWTLYIALPLLCYIYFFCLHLRTFRERGRGLGRERNIDRLPLTCAPSKDQTHNLDMCPDWELNPRPFKLPDDVPTNRATRARAFSFHSSSTCFFAQS